MGKRAARVSTTYCREFSPLWSSSVPAVRRAKDNFSYSSLRRELENSHVVAPFVWEDWEYECNAEPEPAVVKCQHQCKKRHRSNKQRQQPLKASGSVSTDNDCRKSIASTYSQTSPKPSRSTSVDTPKSCELVRTYGKPWKQEKRPCTAPARSFAEPLRPPTPLQRKYSSMRMSAEEPPFIPYGMNHTVLKMGDKRTHNILAAKQVFPSALLAKKRQAIQIHQALDCEDTLPSREKRRMASFNDEFDTWMNKETSAWRSEYSRRFPGYERSEYARQRIY